MASALPKSPYKFKPYIYGPRAGRVHLDGGAPPTAPWWQNAAQDQSEPEPIVPGIVGVTQDQMQAPAPPAMAAPSPDTATESEDSLLNPGYSRSIDRMKELYAEKPERTPPHWWQKGISGALGGLAGWSNAAGRARPIDVTQAVENIQHPGYADKLQDWQSRLAQVQGPMELEGQRQKAENSALDIANKGEARLTSALARKQMADPHRNQQQVTPEWVKENTPWKMPDAKGEYWVDKTVESNWTKPVKEAADRTVEVTDPAAAKFLGVDPKAPIDRDLYKVYLTHKSAMERLGAKPTNVKEDKVWLARQAAKGNQEAINALNFLAKNARDSKQPKAVKAAVTKFDPESIPSGPANRLPLPEGNGEVANDAILERFLLEAGHDRRKAAQLMSQHGWK